MASAASSRSVQILLLICTCFLLPLSLAAQGADDKNSVELVDSQFSFSFDFSNESSYQVGDLSFEGNASRQSNRIDLTCNSRGSIEPCEGRMSYSHPVAFYDDTGALACFSTSFTFLIFADNDSAGDGLAFFLSDYPFKKVPDSIGHLGLISETSTSPSQHFVAVEFDTYQNYWDPSANHIGVDINSIRSSKYKNLRTNGLPGLNGTMTAKVQFDNTTNMLLASLWFDDYPHIDPVVVTYVLTDPKSLLPGQVEVGFSSSTGAATELHQILAWSFNSTLAAPPLHKGKNNSAGKLLGIILPIVFVAVVAAITLYIWNVRKKRRTLGTKLPHRTHTVEDLESIKSTLLSLSSLQVATNYFDESSKLGEGGFGAVYKGDLSGQEVAVKRLSKGSNQGLEELRNELVLVAKLHHKNLVRLEGFCLEEGERLLVYEYMANKSLDTILFDPEEKRRLDWRKRFNIIEGIARGLQYLHEDSQKKIVHRDMKASNVLLDADMNPKIGDFGLARLFEQDQTRDVTNRIVGTFGYMSPEYVMRGQYSTKSDVFSFGILVIEIITGQRNTGHYFHEQNEDIISIVWRHWSEGTIAEMIDDSLGRNYSETEVLKCVNIGLLCLQQNPVDRPTMSDVMVMLNGDATSSLPPAARPTFFLDPSSGTSGYSYASGTVSYPSAS